MEDKRQSGSRRKEDRPLKEKTDQELEDIIRQILDELTLRENMPRGDERGETTRDMDYMDDLDDSVFGGDDGS